MLTLQQRGQETEADCGNQAAGKVQSHRVHSQISNEALQPPPPPTTTVAFFCENRVFP